MLVNETRVLPGIEAQFGTARSFGRFPFKPRPWPRPRLHGEEKREDHPMRSKLLLGTAALLAGIAVASAQNMPGGGGQEKAGGAQHSQGAQGGAAPSGGAVQHS